MRSTLSRETRMSGTCRITTRYTSGDRRSGDIIRRSFILGLVSGGGGFRALILVSILAVGVVGDGVVGDGGAIGSAGASSSTILSFIAMASAVSAEGRWAGRHGRTIRRTAWVCRMAIVRSPTGSAAAWRADSAALPRRDLIVGRARHLANAWGVRVLSSAAIRPNTVSSAVITTAGRRARKATVVSQAWAVGTSAAAADSMVVVAEGGDSDDWQTSYYLCGIGVSVRRGFQRAGALRFPRCPAAGGRRCGGRPRLGAALGHFRSRGEGNSHFGHCRAGQR